MTSAKTEPVARRWPRVSIDILSFGISDSAGWRGGAVGALWIMLV